jgi:PPK2 family polyphosphate:nucleotide phosphotransferase
MIDITKLSTRAPEQFNKDEIQEETKKLEKRLSELQHLLLAQEKYSLLIVLQGMDASGKDGVVKKVFNKMPIFGISVSSFKAPTKQELAHDFLWRVHQETPKKGQIKIFNRSHYEDVLVTRVLGYTDDVTAKKRFELINNFEEIIAHNKTVILKFCLNVSYEMQEERLKDRMTMEHKFHKHSDGDWETRKEWDQYMKYYNECLEHTQRTAPWHIVPVDQNWYKEYYITKTVVEALEKLPLAYPPLDTAMNV